MDTDALMAQARSLQTKISEAQDSLAQMHVKGIAENGAVIVDMTGKYDVVSVVVSDETLAFGSAKVSDLVKEAYKDAKAKADALIDKMMSSITSGEAE